jgi:hypothetical protein
VQPGDHYLAADLILAAFRGAPAISASRFARDVDRLVGQDPTPRS